MIEEDDLGQDSIDMNVYKNEIARLQIQRSTDKARIAELEETIIKLQGEPAPLADKIFNVVVEGHKATLLVNQLVRNMKATLQLYGDQVVDILP